MNFTGAAVVAGVAGWPVEHSRSPLIQNYWLRKYGIDGVYVPLAISPDRALDAIRSLPALGISGLNITVPHKETAFRAMDEVDNWTQRLKAVNTVVVRDGLLYGTNTDAYGFLEALREAHPTWRSSTGPAVILGAGGAARAIVAGLQDEGVSEIRIANRTHSRATALCEEFGNATLAVPWESRSAALKDAALVINTTSLGMRGQAPLNLSLEAVHNVTVVCDIVYTPLETPLLAAARALGHIVVDGLGMLLHQARPGFRQWFGVDPAVDQELRDYVLADLMKDNGPWSS